MNVLEFEQKLAGRRILVTGHTGFMGSWCSVWFHSIGADIHGLALPPDTTPSMFSALGLESLIPTSYVDVRDFDRVREIVLETKPELILHLAAQPLVRRSYAQPLETMEVNAIGTANVLEAARRADFVKGVLCITTDKVYRNLEWEYRYRENDPLGGKDPYSASKAAAEMIAQGYASSFPAGVDGAPAIAIARGGNVVGGGDWSEDRIVPDIVRAIVAGEPITLRYPNATRPWQHVLSLVHGYGVLLAGFLEDDSQPYARAWNIGPDDDKEYTVRMVLDAISRHWTAPDVRMLDQALPEAGKLAIDSALARTRLGLHSPWPIEAILRNTVEWYRAFYAKKDETDGAAAMRAVTQSQIDDWRAACAKRMDECP